MQLPQKQRQHFNTIIYNKKMGRCGLRGEEGDENKDKRVIESTIMKLLKVTFWTQVKVEIPHLYPTYYLKGIVQHFGKYAYSL